MSTAQLRREIKKTVDQLPPDRLVSLADYVQFLNRRDVSDRIAAAQKAIEAGKGVNWADVSRNRNTSHESREHQAAARIICGAAQVQARRLARDLRRG